MVLGLISGLSVAFHQLALSVAMLTAYFYHSGFCGKF